MEITVAGLAPAIRPAGQRWWQLCWSSERLQVVESAVRRAGSCPLLGESVQITTMLLAAFATSYFA